MIRKLKVATIVGTRPEIIRLSRVISVLRRDCQHTLIHTGQNYDYELSEIFFKDLNLAPPDLYLNSAKGRPIQTIASLLSGVDESLRKLSPDAVLVLGDTNSGLGVLAARRLNIPTFHMEAGNRCFDRRVPEEVNRRIIDHVADINLPYSALAREHLLREGLPPDRVIVTGSPLPEVLHFYRQFINESQIMAKLQLQADNYYLVSIHREENVDEPVQLTQLVQLLNHIASTQNLSVIVSTHPRTRERLKQLGSVLHSSIQLINPVAFTEYVHLQLSARLVLSDSGSISEESATLGFRALNLRETHERPEAMEHANVMMIGSSIERFEQAQQIVGHQDRDVFSRLTTPYDYQQLNVAEKISRIIHSYVDVISQNHRA